MSGSIKQYFLKLSIARKMLLGYLSLAVIMVALGVFAISSLDRLNSLNSNIINLHAPTLKAAESLSDAILAQELASRRHAILRNPQTLELLQSKSIEAKELTQELTVLSRKSGIDTDGLIPMIEEYTSILQEGAPLLATPQKPESKKLDERIRNKQEELLTKVQRITRESRKEQERKISSAYQISATAFWITIVLCSLGICAGMLAAMLVTRNVSKSLNTLKLATQHVAEGKFEDLPTVKNKDEIGDLSRAFVDMAERLRSLEEMYLDASPLTHLPGGIAIENILKKRISTGEPLALCLLDMDNFKAYNDYYGYARGSELIQAMGRIVEKQARTHGDHSDFVGHVGGDDFVIITVPGRFKNICSAIIEAFDRMVPEFYDMEARKKGHIMGKTRQGEKVAFPMVTLSIAVVTNKTRQITNHLRMSEIASELKEYAKSLPGSLYVVDHRRKEA